MATTKVDVNLIDASSIGDTKYLKGDGTWGTVDALPSQTSQSGKFLTTDGSDASWGAVAGGITTASQWRLQADFAGDAQPIGGGTGAILVVNSGGYGSLGSSMVYASGIFEFPSTGFWLCLGQFTWTTVANTGGAGYIEYTANDGGAWSTAAWSADASNYGYRSNVNIYHMLDITDKDNQKVRWSVDADPAGIGGAATTMGDSAITETGFTFIKLAGT